jgi:RNA polymerase sigma-70 factor (ECF subfamily)
VTSCKKKVVSSLSCVPRANGTTWVAGKQNRRYNGREALQVVSGVSLDFRRFCSIAESNQTHTMNEVDSLMQRAGALASGGTDARRAGNETAAEDSFRGALALALDAAQLAHTGKTGPARVEILQTAALLALEFGNVVEARRLVVEAASADPSAAEANEWQRVGNVSEWRDGWLIAAVRCDSPDEAALDELVERHWKPLFARCHMLTLNHEKAKDLAQDVWRRVLRARQSLKPGGNFPAYLATIATNLWRDAHRAATRAGPMADGRIESLDSVRSGDEDSAVTLADVLPDLKALRAEDQKLLALDIDHALERLSPLLRDVVVSRFIAGESCAEIGKRYRRTEQTVSGWVRQALREMKDYFVDPAHASSVPNES